MKYLIPVLLLLFISCSVREILPPPTPQEFYYRSLSMNEKLVWDSLASLAIQEEVKVDLPYQELIIGDSSTASFYAFNLDLKYGEILKIEATSIDAFVEIFKITYDSTNRFEKVYNQDYLKDKHYYEVGKTGSHFLLIKPKLSFNKTIDLRVFTEPIYSFPVAGGKERDIGSFWGDPRDGGRRKHKGIDIFAKRGKPLIACISGRIRSVKDRGLGGKQVWLADRKRNQSIYYAHLNEQLVREGQYVEKGDTIGTVGNTGNAKTTPPHLHFGIYKAGIGALDPFYFVKPSNLKFTKPNANYHESQRFAKVAPNLANLRQGPSNRKKIIRKAKRGEVLEVIGISGNWFHVRSGAGQAAYIYKTSLRFESEPT